MIKNSKGKRIFAIASITATISLILIATIFVFAVAPVSVRKASAAPLTNTPSCTAHDKSLLDFLWKHVYDPTRLAQQQYCIAVTGTIISQHVEPDGDSHISLKLDSAYLKYSTSSNKAGQLILEVICNNPTTQTKPSQACQGTTQGFITVPPVNTHVIATGTYVLDKDHNNWGEIHPIASLFRG